MAVHMGSSAKGVPFGAFQRRRASFRAAGAALWTRPMSMSALREVVTRCKFRGRRGIL